MLAKQVDSKKRAVSQKDGQAWAAAKGFRCVRPPFGRAQLDAVPVLFAISRPSAFL
jgi:hypothetical protein